MAQHTTRPQMIKATERRLYVLGLRRSGATYRDIAAAAIERFGVEALPKGYGYRYACNDVMTELGKLEKLTQGMAAEFRELELLRLDRMEEAIWPFALGIGGKEGDLPPIPSLGAIDRAIRIGERRAKLLGLDAPVKVAPTDPEGKSEYSGGGVGDDERAKRLYQMARDLATETSETPGRAADVGSPEGPPD